MIQQPEQWHAVGRRKSAVARVYLRPGTGKIVVNHRPVEAYFTRDTTRQLMLEPFVVAEVMGNFDVVVNVRGGGKSGQAGAVRHALARALVEHSPEKRGALKRAGLLTRDARRVERKKYGQPGARKRFQFSKR